MLRGNKDLVLLCNLQLQFLKFWIAVKSGGRKPVKLSLVFGNEPYRIALAVGKAGQMWERVSCSVHCRGRGSPLEGVTNVLNVCLYKWWTLFLDSLFLLAGGVDAG